MRSTFEGFKAFAEEVDRIERAKQDYIVPLAKVTMPEPERLTLATVGEFGLTPNGHRQLAEKLGIPWDYYDKIKEVPGLREYNVHTLAQHKGGEKKLIRTLDGDVRAVLGQRFKPIDNFLFLDAMLPALKEVGPENLLMKTYALTPEHMYLQVAFPQTQVPLVQPGRHEFLDKPQALMAGLTFRNSEVGKSRVEVRKMAWNLVCWNGAIAEQVLSMYHLGRELEGGEENGGNGNIWSDDTLRKEIELIRLKARDIIRDAMNAQNMEEFVAKAKAAIEHTITCPMEDVITNVTKRWDFTKEEGQGILEAVLEGGAENKTQWGLANAITALVHNTKGADRQYDLERVGEEVIELSEKDWKVIAN